MNAQSATKFRARRRFETRHRVHTWRDRCLHIHTRYVTHIHTYIHTFVMLPTRFLARARIVAQHSKCPEYFGKETLLKNAYVIYRSAFIVGPHVVCLQIHWHVISVNMLLRSIILLPLCKKVNFSSSCISLGIYTTSFFSLESVNPLHCNSRLLRWLLSESCERCEIN